MLGIFEIALRLRDMHVFMWQSLEVLNVFNTLTLKQISGKRKAFPKNWSTVFKFKPLRLKAHHFHTKMLCQKPMLRQTEWRLQNEPTTKNGVLPVTTSQQTFILMKTSWRRIEDVFCLCLQKTSSRHLDQDEHIRLSHASSRRRQDVLVKTNIFVLVTRLQDVFKRFSRRLLDVSEKRLQDIFKKNSRKIPTHQTPPGKFNIFIKKL